MNSFFYWLAETVRPLYGHQRAGSRFDREQMLRDARISSALNMRTGVFAVLGVAAARRAAKAWRPREFYYMEDIGLVFDRIEEQRLKGVIIDPSDLGWLINVVSQYFQYLKQPVSKTDVRRLVEDYLAENSVDEPVSEFEEVDIDHPLLERLREIDQEIESRFPSEIRPAGLHHVGLYVTRDFDASRYPNCTPNNVRTFAATGGEGCHFSFLVQDGRITEASPVVVTAPGLEGFSAIVGDNLLDFLCLGCKIGYDRVEYLTYKHHENLAPAIEQYIRSTVADPEEHPTVEDAWDALHRQILEYLRSQLDLQPWTRADHFYELQEQYLHLLRYPPGAEPPT